MSVIKLTSKHFVINAKVLRNIRGPEIYARLIKFNIWYSYNIIIAFDFSEINKEENTSVATKGAAVYQHDAFLRLLINKSLQ